MVDMVETVCVEHALDGKRRVLRPHERLTSTRMRLRARHGRRRIIEHHDRDIMPVVRRIGQACHTTSEEGGIAHISDGLLAGVDSREPLRHRNASAHAQAGIDHLERLGVAERIAADVAAHDSRRFAERLLDGVEAAPVRATRAQHGRTHGQLVLVADRSNVVVASTHFETVATHAPSKSKELLDAHGNVVDIVLAAAFRFARKLAVDVDGHMSATGELCKLILDDVIELLEDQDIAQPSHELSCNLFGERIGSAHLHEPVRRHVTARFGHICFDHAECLARIRCANTTCDDAVNSFGGSLDLVERLESLVACIIVRDIGKALVDLAMRLVSATREDDPFRNVALEPIFRHLERMRLVFDVEKCGSMVDARGRTDDDGRVVALGQLECGLYHAERLLRRGRVEDRHFCKRCEPARVLFGLRRNGTRVVGDDQHKPSAHAHVVQAHERVACDVEAHLLAREQTAGACERGAEQDLECHFLVRRPFHMHAMRST